MLAAPSGTVSGVVLLQHKRGGREGVGRGGGGGGGGRVGGENNAPNRPRFFSHTLANKAVC